MAKETQQSGDGASAAELISTQVTRAIPNIICEVLPGQSVSLGDATLGPGDDFEIEGPSAIALVQAGHVKITGSVEEPS